MNDSHRSIFRADFVQQYMQGRDRSILPRLIAPRTFVCLWLLIGLLTAGAFLAWFARVPIYTSGPAVIVDGRDYPGSIDDSIALVVFLPPQYRSHLHVGQPLFLDFGSADGRLRRTIIMIEPQLSSPAAVQQRFALRSDDPLSVTRPTIVALARVEPLPSSLPPATFVGSRYQVDVEVGSRRMLALVPLIGQLFDE